MALSPVLQELGRQRVKVVAVLQRSLVTRGLKFLPYTKKFGKQRVKVVVALVPVVRLATSRDVDDTPRWTKMINSHVINFSNLLQFVSVNNARYRVALPMYIMPF